MSQQKGGRYYIKQGKRLSEKEYLQAEKAQKASKPDHWEDGTKGGTTDAKKSKVEKGDDQ